MNTEREKKKGKKTHNLKNNPTYLTPAPTTATLLPEPENPITKAINSQKHTDFEQLNQN